MSQRPRLHWYRWEGIYTADFSLNSLQRRCWRLGDILAQQNWSCLIAHDTRFMSGQFARHACTLLESRGVQTYFSPTPSPMPPIELALEQKRADCALIISAANRPYWYNGMVVLAPQLDQPLADAEAIPPEFIPPFPPTPTGTTEPNQIDLRTPYQDVIRTTLDIDLIRRSTLTLFVDPMNGSTNGMVPAIIGEGTQTKAIEINRETDPLFSRQPPQPMEAGLQRLRKLVKESDSHLGIALSADGRALGLIDNIGELVAPLEVTLLMAQYLVRQYRQKGAVIVPPPAPDEQINLQPWEQALGLRVEVSPDPAARINELLVAERNSLLVGATGAGEITLGRYSGSPDAILVGMLLIEMAARSGGRVRMLVDELRDKLSN